MSPAGDQARKISEALARALTVPWSRSIAIAGLLALLASMGGGWGTAVGQTAGPPPARSGSGASGASPYQAVTPPPASEYRPAAIGPAPTTSQAPLAGDAGPSPEAPFISTPVSTAAAAAGVPVSSSPTPAEPPAAPTPGSPTENGALAWWPMGIGAVAVALAVGAWERRRRRR